MVVGVVPVQYHKKIADAIDAEIKKHGVESLEFEFRIGKIVKQGPKKVFESNINKTLYDTVVKTLKTCKKWDDVVSSSVENHMGKGDKRTTIDLITKQTKSIEKKRLKNIDIEMVGCPFDIRFSISSEIPLDDTVDVSKSTIIRRQNRESFLYRMWSFDMTQVNTIKTPDKDTDETDSYEIEIELVDKEKAFKFPSKYVAEFGTLLCQDIVQMVKDNA